MTEWIKRPVASEAALIFIRFCGVRHRTDLDAGKAGVQCHLEALPIAQLLAFEWLEKDLRGASAASPAPQRGLGV
jgi:hypothetical protein